MTIQKRNIRKKKKIHESIKQLVLIGLNIKP